MPLYKEGEVNKYDIGHYMQIRVNSKNIFKVIENLWKLDELFEFPITIEGKGDSKQCKRFLPNWLKVHNWLSYSKLYDGAFCYPCVFFGHSTGHNRRKLDVLYKSPLTYWTSASGKFNDHKKNVPYTQLLWQQWKII